MGIAKKPRPPNAVSDTVTPRVMSHTCVQVKGKRMHTPPRLPLCRRRFIPCNERGVVLVVGLMILMALTLLGVTATVTTMADLKVGVNYRRNTEAFYLAEAGAEQGREQLRALNAASAAQNAFTDELTPRIGANGVLNGYATGTDDVPLVPQTTLGNGSYIVYVTNDAIDGSSVTADANRRATLISVGTIPNGTKDASQAIIETTVAMFNPFPLPAAITLLGSGANFTGGNSNAKELHGDDYRRPGELPCGNDPPKPVVAVTNPADVGNLQSNINSSQPATYKTKNAAGVTVTAATNPNDISGSIPGSQLTDINNNYGINLLDPVALTGLVTSIQAQADTVAAGGSSCGSVGVGTAANPKVVVVTGDFDLSSGCKGTGILVVTGTLTFHGNIDYRGLILVIGEGHMERYGGGNGTIAGGIVVANTRGQDNIPGNADDIVLGKPFFSTAGGGNGQINHCSTALYDAYSRRPLRIISWRPRYR